MGEKEKTDSRKMADSSSEIWCLHNSGLLRVVDQAPPNVRHLVDEHLVLQFQ